MEDKLIMRKKERERKVILFGYEEDRDILVEAAERMEVSYRQAKRIWCCYRKKNDAGMIHKSRSKPSTRAIDEKTKKLF